MDNGNQEALTYTPARPSRFREDVPTEPSRFTEDHERSESGQAQDSRRISSSNGMLTGAKRLPQRQRKQTEFYQPSGFLAELADEPSTVREALSGTEAEYWSRAIESELQSLQQHSVWSVRKLPEGFRPLS